MTNVQDRNVGNRGDVLKHAALVALADLVGRGDAGKVTYLETHAYRVDAPCDVARWRAACKAARLPSSAFDHYVALESPWIERGRYRCSVGLAIDLLPGARFVLCERHEPTRRALVKELDARGLDYLVLDDAKVLAQVGGASPRPVLALVDPFKRVDRAWPPFSHGLTALRGSWPAIALVFQYDKAGATWPAPPPDLVGPVARIEQHPYHLAAYATPAEVVGVRAVLPEVGWTLLASDP